MVFRQSNAAVAIRSNQARRFGLLGILVVMASGIMLSACNTTAGAGQDVSATGNAVTRGARDVERKL